MLHLIMSKLPRLKSLGRVNSLRVVFFQQWASIWVMPIYFLDELDGLVMEEGGRVVGVGRDLDGYSR